MSNADELAKFANNRDADRVNYDNTTSGLAATEVQALGDELALRSGLTIDPTTRFANFIATTGKIFKIDTRGGGFNITMPVSPGTDVQFGWIDVGGDLAANNAVLKYNGTDKIMRLAEDNFLNLNNFSSSILFDGIANGWIYR